MRDGVIGILLERRQILFAYGRGIKISTTKSPYIKVLDTGRVSTELTYEIFTALV